MNNNPFECCFECQRRYGATEDHLSCHSSCEDYQKSMEAYKAAKQKRNDFVDTDKAIKGIRSGYYITRKNKLNYFYRGK